MSSTKSMLEGWGLPVGQHDTVLEALFSFLWYVKHAKSVAQGLLLNISESRIDYITKSRISK